MSNISLRVSLHPKYIECAGLALFGNEVPPLECHLVSYRINYLLMRATIVASFSSHHAVIQRVILGV